VRDVSVGPIVSISPGKRWKPLTINVFVERTSAVSFIRRNVHRTGRSVVGIPSHSDDDCLLCVFSVSFRTVNGDTLVGQKQRCESLPVTPNVLGDEQNIETVLGSSKLPPEFVYVTNRFERYAFYVDIYVA